jgi:hypothetical protein
VVGLAGLLVGATATNLFILDQGLWMPACLLLATAWSSGPLTADR